MFVRVQKFIHNRKRFALSLIGAALATMSAVPAFAQEAPSPDFDINLDLSPFFDAFVSFLPTFVGAFAVIFAISAALGFAFWILGKIADAFSGRG